MNTANFKILPALVTDDTLTNTDILIERGNATCDAAQASSLRRACEDALSGVGGQATRARIAAAINARRKGINEVDAACADTDGETSSTHIQLPDIGDIAPGGVVAPCLADVERMLADQHMEPTALNWIALCDHFLSLPLISVGHAGAFRLLRKAIERAALRAVRIDLPPASRRISQEAAE